MKLVGLDIGTTGCTCTVFDEQGKYLNKAYRDYPVRRKVGSHEVDISVIMDGVYAVLKEMAGQYPDIAGVGVTSFGETFVMTDQAGRPLHTAMLYTDPHGEEECRELVQTIGKERMEQITGLYPHHMYSISKMMWIKRHRPEVYQRAEHIFLMEDYVVWQLTGKRQIDYSLTTRTMAFDIQKLSWCEEIFQAAGIDVRKMSPVVPTGTDAGRITPETARRTGLDEAVHIVSVSHDQISATVGAGIFDASAAVDGAGTVECITSVYDSLPDVQKMCDGYFAVAPYVIPGKYVAYAFSYTGGALIQWCVDTLAKEEKHLAKEAGISVNEYLEREYREKRGEDEPGSLLVLPHFAGAATPYMDSGSKGTIIGLTLDSTVADIYRGCMEGVVYEMLVNLEALKKAGCYLKKMNATGGGARSGEWMQMKADILNISITALKTVDAGTVGSAMLTGIALGVFQDLEDAAAHMVEKTTEYLPRAEMHEKYRKNYERYAKIYQAVRPLVG